MKRVTRLLVWAACLSVGLAAMRQTEISPAGISSVGAQEVPNSPRQQLDAGIPSAALLTDRGRALVENLRNLRRTRANLGPKHPTLPVIEKAISETEQQLRAWLPEDPAEENPFKNLDSPPQRSRRATRNDTADSVMNDTDLRQLVLRLHARIEALEARVETLERSLK